MMNLHTHLLLIIFGILFSINHGTSQTYLLENFEEPIADSWNEYVNDAFQWDTLNGGYKGHPKTAKQGNLNAIYQVVSYEQPSTILAMPAANLKYAIQPELTFFHAQEERVGNQDILEVLYKLGKDSAWRSIKEYTNSTPYNTWVERNIQLPDSARSDSCIIGFKATSNNGFGVCIDSVRIVERGEQAMSVDTVTFNQDFDQHVISQSPDNPIMRIGIEITGNIDTLALDSIDLKSSNTDDNDIQEQGVSLYYTDEPFFTNKNKIDSNITITNGNILFDNLNVKLPTGFSYFWVTYDIDSDSTHEIHQNTIDAYVEADAIRIGGSTYPSETIHPEGNRTILEALFYDDFETDKGWVLTGEFERDAPRGLGGENYGNADPTSALIGSNVIGTDLTGLGSNDGKYEPGISKDAYSATTQTIDGGYYRNLTLIFNRWLNIDVVNNDTASLYYSIDDGATWEPIWHNSEAGATIERDWNRVTYQLPPETEYESQFKLRVALGPTDGSRNYSGWNIDKFAIIGDYIATDLAVTDITSPVDGCGHSSTDTIIARVKNNGADTIYAPVPLVCSPDGGTTIIRDSIYNDLVPGQDTLYTFTKTVDLSEPGLYNQFYVRADLANDEYRGNDTSHTNIYAPATYELPYNYDFEENENDFWESGGTNNSWEWGIPSGSVITPDEGASDHTWITNMDGTYNNNENSFVSSPCFDFKEKDFPVITLRIYSDGQPGEDGAHFQYSLDEGLTWKNVDTLFYNSNFNWEWYNNLDTIEGINAPGWDQINSGWYEVKTFLPAEITNKENIKFRVHFGSNNSNRSEGFAFDDIQIFNAPDDVGIDTIYMPQSQCEPSASTFPVVGIKNYGLDSINAGDTIPLGIDMQIGSEPTISTFDTCVVTEAIPPDSIYQYTFSKSINLEDLANYSISAYTLLEENPGFYNTETSNDTSSKQIDIYGYPTADLGPDINTVEPDTLTLSTPFDATYSYSWTGPGDASNNEYTNLNITTVDTVIVEVTNTNTGCQARDSAIITKLQPDLGVDSILSPNSGCEIGAETYIRARVKNYGTDTLFINDNIVLGAIADGSSVLDTFQMENRLNPGDTFVHHFNKPIDMSALNTTYNLQVFTQLIPASYDVNNSNDTTTKQVTSYGFPELNLNTDTAVNALSYVIQAPTGYQNYAWEYPAGNTPEFTVTDSLYEATGDEWYSVTVTDYNGCSSTDSAHVKLIIHDLLVSQKIAPLSDCEHSTNTQVAVEVKNNGTDTLTPSEQVYVGFEFNGTFIKKDTITLTENFMPDSTLVHQFDNTLDLSAPGDYTFNFFTLQPKEMRPSNDNLEDTTTTFGRPALNIGPDTVVAALSYTIDPGSFESYLWHNDSTYRYFTVEEETETANDYYTVMVTDEHGCTNTDSVEVILSVTDITPVSLLQPQSACSMPEPVSVEIAFTNQSDYSFDSGTQIPLGYSIEGQKAKDTLTLNEAFAPNDTINHTFAKMAEIAGEGYHTFQIFVNYPQDLVPSNDTMSLNVEVYGAAPVNLGADTLKLEQEEFPYYLDAGEQFTSYEWQDGSPNRTYEVRSPGIYHVTVTDTLGCQGSDTIRILLDTSESGTVNSIIAAKNYQILVYPIPAYERLTVDIDAERLTQMRLMLFNNQGKVIHNNEITTRRKKYHIQTRDLPRGIYYLRIITKEDIHTKKVIIQ